MPSRAPPQFPLLKSKKSSSSSFRSFSTSRRKCQQAPSSTPPEPSNARWLSQTKARIGKCIFFGLNDQQTAKASRVLKALGEEWRDLVAGREGFLVDKKRAGLFRQKVVWGEMDTMGHVNNVTYVRYAESARTNWASNYAGMERDSEVRRLWKELLTARGTGLILKSILVDYKFPMTWPDHISVFHKLRSLPSPSDSSFILDVMILSELHQRPAARCVEDIVVYDYREGRKTELRPFMMDAFKETWELQEAEKRTMAGRIEELDQAVRELETESWDRKGAVEDMGSGR